MTTGSARHSRFLDTQPRREAYQTSRRGVVDFRATSAPPQSGGLTRSFLKSSWPPARVASRSAVPGTSLCARPGRPSVFPNNSRSLGGRPDSNFIGGAVRRRLLPRVSYGGVTRMSVDQSTRAAVPEGTPASHLFSEPVSAGADTASGTPTSLFAAVQRVHTRMGRNAAKRLALITGQDPKTAQRQSTKRPPSAGAFYQMLLHPVVGVAILKEATSTLTREKRRDYWCRMVVAAGDVLREEDSL